MTRPPLAGSPPPLAALSSEAPKLVKGANAFSPICSIAIIIVIAPLIEAFFHLLCLFEFPLRCHLSLTAIHQSSTLSMCPKYRPAPPRDIHSSLCLFTFMQKARCVCSSLQCSPHAINVSRKAGFFRTTPTMTCLLPRPWHTPGGLPSSPSPSKRRDPMQNCCKYSQAA